MKRRVKYLFVLIAAVLLFPMFGQQQASAAVTNPIKKIGLYYGSSALTYANLQNYTGSGYKVGYYDNSRNFVSVAGLSNTKVTVIKNKNFNAVNDTYYSTAPSAGSSIVGCYHLQSSITYSTAGARDTEIARLKGLGLDAYPAYVNSKYVIRIGHYTTTTAASSAVSAVNAKMSGATLYTIGNSSTCFTVIATGTNTILFQFDSTPNKLGIQPQSSSAQSQTWFKGYRYYGGFEYIWATAGGNITVINVVDLASYVKGVIPYETNPNWPIESQKAQALCAKCYAYSNTKHSGDGFDLCNTADCQVYYGCGNATPLSDSAVDAIMGKNISYNGSSITAYYHSSDGGATEDSENVWVTALGYLRGVKDPYEVASKIPDYYWTYSITANEIATILTNKGYAVNGVKNMYVSKYTPMGNVYCLTVVDNSGKIWNFEKALARSILGVNYVRSQRYSIQGGAGATLYVNDGQALTLSLSSVFVQGADSTPGLIADPQNVKVITSKGIVNASTVDTTQTGVFTISGSGYGHNVGMSQYGVRFMADKGLTYDQMLKFYYTGVKIEDMS